MLLVRLTMEPFIVLNYTDIRPHSKIAKFWAVIVVWALILKRDIAYLYVVFSNIHRPGCRKYKGLVKENFLLGYLSSLKICLLYTFTCLVKWFSTFYSTCTTFDRQ